MSKKPIRFRVNAFYRSKLWIDCYVWPNQKTMTDYNYKEHQVPRNPSYAAICVGEQCLVVTKKRIMIKRLAEIHFNRRKLTPEVLVHESTHAALRACDYRSIDVSNVLKRSYKHNVMCEDSGEERLCYSVGWISRGVINALYKYGVWGDSK